MFILNLLLAVHKTILKQNLGWALPNGSDKAIINRLWVTLKFTWYQSFERSLKEVFGWLNLINSYSENLGKQYTFVGNDLISSLYECTSFAFISFVNVHYTIYLQDSTFHSEHHISYLRSFSELIRFLQWKPIPFIPKPDPKLGIESLNPGNGS